MIRKVLIFNCLILILLGLPSITIAQNLPAVSTPPPKAQASGQPYSMKNIQNIYLGYFQGEPQRAKCFCEQLTYYLNKYGFTVVSAQADSDATLLGSFHALANLVSNADVVLINPQYKELWKYHTETPWFGNSRFKLGAYFSNSNQYACGGGSEKWRAIYVAQALKKAKSKASKP